MKTMIVFTVLVVAAVAFVRPLNERVVGIFLKPGSIKDHNVAVTKNAPSKVSARSATDVLSKAGNQTKSGQKVSYDIKRIQSILKKAELYKGDIDGRMGPETVKAIKKFQKMRRLQVSGVINARTWEELRKTEAGR